MFSKLMDLFLNKMGYQKKPRFPQAGVGSGVILYCRTANPHELRVACAKRSAKVGVGYGISFGGWIDLASLEGTPKGTIISTKDSAMREGGEEVTGLFTVITSAVLRGRMQYLTAITSYVPDDPYGNLYHHGTYYGAEVKEREAETLETLPPSDETEEPVTFFTITWQPGRGREKVTGLPGPFHHKHEVAAFRALAAAYEEGRLYGLK